MNDGAMIPSGEAAQRLGTTPLNILMHIKRGLLEGEEQDGAWFVSVSSLEAFIHDQGGEADRQLCRKSCPSAASCSTCG